MLASRPQQLKSFLLRRDPIIPVTAYSTSYYWAKLYTEQLSESEGYDSLSKAIGIYILNFISINNERYHNCFHIREQESGECYSPDLELHTIELKKFSGE